MKDVENKNVVGVSLKSDEDGRREKYGGKRKTCESQALTCVFARSFGALSSLWSPSKVVGLLIDFESKKKKKKGFSFFSFVNESIDVVVVVVVVVVVFPSS